MSLYYPSARVSLTIIPAGRDLLALGDEDKLKLTDIKPVSCQVKSNDLHTADTFELVLEESVFPVDPRVIQTVSVAIFMGDAGGINRKLDTGQGDEVILGIVDDIEKNFSRTDKDTITLKGRDYSTFLLDTEWGDSVYVDLKGPITEIVQTVLESVPATRLMRAVSLFDTEPTFPDAPKSKSHFIAKSGASIWEGLSEISARIGAIVTVRADQVIIRPPRTADANAAMPLFVHGQNLESLAVKCEYGQHTTSNIVVRARNSDTFKTVVGRWPTKAKKTTTAQKSRKQTQTAASEKTTSFSIRHPAPTVELLTEIARQVWIRHAQQKLKISFSTKEMRVWEAPQSVIDAGTVDEAMRNFEVTRLRNGDSVRIHIGRQTRNILQKAVNDEQQARYLRQQGFAQSVAAELARGWRRIDSPMFVVSASHRIDEGGKYSLDVECENQITVDI